MRKVMVAFLFCFLLKILVVVARSYGLFGRDDGIARMTPREKRRIWIFTVMVNWAYLFPGLLGLLMIYQLASGFELAETMIEGKSLFMAAVTAFSAVFLTLLPVFLIWGVLQFLSVKGWKWIGRRVMSKKEFQTFFG